MAIGYAKLVTVGIIPMAPPLLVDVAEELPLLLVGVGLALLTSRSMYMLLNSVVTFEVAWTVSVPNWMTPRYMVSVMLPELITIWIKS